MKNFVFEDFDFEGSDLESDLISELHSSSDFRFVNVEIVEVEEESYKCDSASEIGTLKVTGEWSAHHPDLYKDADKPFYSGTFSATLSVSQDEEGNFIFSILVFDPINDLYHDQGEMVLSGQTN